MNWYYVEAGQQAGPVNDTELDGLVDRGKVLADTLVWREGMANWQPYREVRPARPVADGAPPVIGRTNESGGASPEAVCAECGNLFAVEDMIRFGDARVCASCKPIFVQKLSEGAKFATGALPYAGFWIRFAAKFVDGLIIGVFFLVPLFYLGMRSYQDKEPGKFLALRLSIQLGFYVANLAYQIFFLGKYGATPGKMLCKLKVVTAEGGRIGYGRATGRYFAEILSGLICYIGYIIAGFDAQKRALHDHLCNTRVVFK